MSDETMEWDGEVSPPEDDYGDVIEEGKYPFVITGVKQAISTGEKTNGKLMAVIDLLLQNGDTTHTKEDRIVLIDKMRWKMRSLFVSVGLGKKGEAIELKWNNLVGKNGWCEVTLSDYTNKKGVAAKSVNINYLAPEDAPSASFNPAELEEEDDLI